METGSVITADNGVQALARAASRDEKYSREILPCVLEHLRTCRAQSLPQHAEKSLIAINAGNKARERMAAMIQQDLRRIGILAGSFFLVLVVLAIFQNQLLAVFIKK